MAKVGRKRKDDDHLLLRMALLLVQGLAESIRAAARLVAADGAGASVNAIVDRLRHAYSKRRADLERRAREQLAAPDRPRRRERLLAGSLPRDRASWSDPDSPAKDHSSPVAKKPRD
jgi:hypothetical protein